MEREVPGQKRMGSGSVESAVRSPYVKEAVHEGWKLIFQNQFPGQPKAGKPMSFS